MVREDIKEFISTIPKNVCLIAATKYVEACDMVDLYKQGIYNFGENRVDSFLKKYDALKDFSICWHFIGHLQRNKAKLVANKIDYLHSLDSIELARLLNSLREKPLKVFIEVSINLEEQKNGVSYKEIIPFIEEIKALKNIEIVGFMMMTIKNSSSEEAKRQFEALRDLKEQVSKKLNITIPYLSMGMSDDYKEAIEADATHIRLGRILWKN